jgi:cysteine synthase B
MHTIETAREFATLAAAIGRTPLVRLRRFEPRAGVEIYAKLESRNPGGSVKDRAALRIIQEAEHAGLLGHGRTLLDATSGNTGIAYAMLGAARGYPVRLCVPGNVTPERKRLLAAYGADLIFTDAMEGSDGAIREAQRLFALEPDRYFYADQYSNPANWRAHYDTTGPEIIQQSEGRLTHFVAGLGTSGTFVGTARRLREWRPGVTLVSFQPESPFHGLEGLKHMATAIVPAIYDGSLADRDLGVSTEEAFVLTRRLAREEGIFVGPSSGAALGGSLEVASALQRGVIVTVFPDGGDRYLSERFWDADDGDWRIQYRRATAPREDGRAEIPRALRVHRTARETIETHAASVYPDECCGALVGPAPDAVTEAVPLANVHDENRQRRFLIDARTYRHAEALADARGQVLVGFYHSHPDHPAEPSRFDLEHAWPNLSYPIVSVRGGEPRAMRSWRLRPDRTAFDEENIDTLED